MRFRGSWAGLPAAVTLLLSACGGRSFVIVEFDGAVDDGEAPVDAAPVDAVTPDVKGANDAADAGEDGDASTDTDAGGPRTCPIPATISQRRCLHRPGPRLSVRAAHLHVRHGPGHGLCLLHVHARALGVPPADVEAGAPPPSCPGPKLVHEAVPCATPGEECPGNPTTCSGGTEIFYDVFQRNKAMLWTRIIATVCGDGG